MVLGIDKLWPLDEGKSRPTTSVIRYRLASTWKYSIVMRINHPMPGSAVYCPYAQATGRRAVYALDQPRIRSITQPTILSWSYITSVAWIVEGDNKDFQNCWPLVRVQPTSLLRLFQFGAFLLSGFLLMTSRTIFSRLLRLRTQDMP